MQAPSGPSALRGVVAVMQPQAQKGKRTPELSVCSQELTAAHHKVSDGQLRARPALAARDTEMTQTARSHPLSRRTPSRGVRAGRQTVSVLSLSLTRPAGPEASPASERFYVPHVLLKIFTVLVY